MRGRGGSGRADWVPKTDVYTTDGGLAIKAELSGMQAENMEITFEGNCLWISGTRRDRCRVGKANFLITEINYGPFESVLELAPGFNLSMAKAAYSNGFLRIDIPGVPPLPRDVPQSSVGREGSGKPWVPNTDVYTTDSGLVIKVELAGMRSENIEITCEANRLQISGTRPDDRQLAKLVKEINYGPYKTVLELPPGYDLSRARAAYLNGFLRIDIPEGPGAPSLRRRAVQPVEVDTNEVALDYVPMRR